MFGQGGHQATKERQPERVKIEDLRLPKARWESERVDGDDEGWRRRLAAIVDSPMLEAVVSACVAVDLGLTIFTFSFQDAEDSTSIFIISALLLVVMFADVMLRVLREGRKFWARPLNWLEFLVALVGVTLLTVDGVRSYCAECSNDKGNGRTGASIGRSVRPLMKGCRIFRAFTIIATGAGGLTKRSDRIAQRMILTYLRDVCILPPENISTQPSQGKVHIEKAQVRSQAFDGLHLPFNIASGILDLFHFKVDLSTGLLRRREESTEDMKGLVVIENMLLVLGPGHHQDRGRQWEFDHVADAKARLIELLTARMEASAKPKLSTIAAGVRGHGRTFSRSVMPLNPKVTLQNMVRRVARGIVRSALTNGLHVSVRNLEIRYEDCHGELTRGGEALVAGFRIDSASMRIRVADPLETTSGFRARGRWATVAEVNAGSQGLHTVCSTGSALTAHESTSTRDVKVGIKEGVMVSMKAADVCSFWDILQGAASDNVDSLYTSKLRQGSGVDISAFLQANARRHARERARLALCREVEERLANYCGPRYASERARKLRDRFAAHTYLVLPFRCTVHSILRPLGKWAPKIHRTQSHQGDYFETDSEAPTSPKAGSVSHSPTETGSAWRRRFWQPHNDVSIEVQGLCINLDLAQGGSFLYLLDYWKRWCKDDRRIRSRPQPRDVYQAPISMYWSYAVSRVLLGIDPNYRWKSLSWLELRLITFYRSEYFAALSSETGRSKDRLRALQVALPLGTALAVRQEGASALATKRYLRKAQASRNRAAWLSFAGTSEMTDLNWSEEAFLGGEHGGGHGSHGSLHGSLVSGSFVDYGASSSKKELRIDIKGQQDALQVCCNVGTMRIYLLQPPASSKRATRKTVESVASALSAFPDPIGRNLNVRRQLISFRASGLNVLLTNLAPRNIWMRMSPPRAVSRIVDAEEEVPEGITSEATLDEFYVVWCEAPPSAPHMRRVAACSRVLASSTLNPWCTTGHLDTSDGNGEGCSGASLWMQKRHAARFVVGACAGQTGRAGPESPWHYRHGAKAPQEGEEEDTGDWSARSFVRRAGVAVRLRVAYMGHVNQLMRFHGTPHWEFAMCVLPVQGHICKPLLVAVLRTLKAARESPHSRSSQQRRKPTSASAAGEHVVEHTGSDKRSVWATTRASQTSSISLSDHFYAARRGSALSEWVTKEAMLRASESTVVSSWNAAAARALRRTMTTFKSTRSVNSSAAAAETKPVPTELKFENFWDYVHRLRRQHVARQKLKKKERQAEAIIGVSGLFRSALITGEVLCLGGLQGALLERGTRTQWLTRTIKLPPGIITIERGRTGREESGGRKSTGISTSFTPLAGSPVQADDGWWFPNVSAMERQAKAQEPAIFSQLTQLSQLGTVGKLKSTESVPDKWNSVDYNIGDESYELPMSEILLTPGREFGFEVDCEVTQRAAFVVRRKPAGLRRTGLGNDAALPASPDTAIQRLTKTYSKLTQTLSHTTQQHTAGAMKLTQTLPHKAQQHNSGAMATPLLKCTTLMHACSSDCAPAADTQELVGQKTIIDSRTPYARKPPHEPARAVRAVPAINYWSLGGSPIQKVADPSACAPADLNIDIHLEMVHAGATGLPGPLVIQDAWSWAETVEDEAGNDIDIDDFG